MFSASCLKRLRMNKILRNRKILLCSIIPKLEVDIDFEKYKEYRGLFIEDPWERVKSIFSKDDFGGWHPELITAMRMAQYGAVAGAFYGMATESFIETQNHFRTSDTNIYSNKNEAYKDLNNRTLLAASKGSLRWAPSFALFCGSYSLISSCSELYRNKVDILDNIIAGASVGALSKFMFGFKGMISGGLVGGLLGTIYGTTVWVCSKLTQKDILEIKYAQFAYIYFKKKRNINNLPSNEEDKKVLESGLHALHDSNPLSVLEDKTEKKEKHVSKTEDK